jgi:hypothetical protein
MYTKWLPVHKLSQHLDYMSLQIPQSGAPGLREYCGSPRVEFCIDVGPTYV